MDIQRASLVHKGLAKFEFWKGIVAGTIAGMAIAAFTFEILDRRPKLKTVNGLLPDQAGQESNQKIAA